MSQPLKSPANDMFWAPGANRSKRICLVLVLVLFVDFLAIFFFFFKFSGIQIEANHPLICGKRDLTDRRRRGDLDFLLVFLLPKFSN